MKASKLYSGYDSAGRQINVAQRIDGKWFYREYGWNGYGNSWSRWAILDEAPEHPVSLPSRIECSDAEEYIEIPADQRELKINWGFNYLSLQTGTPWVRLPNAA